jgi:hypothetical protein
VPPSADAPFSEFGGWLRLPWLPILSGANDRFAATVFQPESTAQIGMLDFRHYFASYFIRWIVLRTWWIGTLIGAIMVVRRGGMIDLPWGLIAGTLAGLGISATVAAFFLVVEFVPHLLWHLMFGAQGGIGYLALWILLAIFHWLFVAVLLGLLAPLIAPLRRLLVDPFQALIASAFGTLGLRTLSEYWNPA